MRWISIGLSWLFFVSIATAQNSRNIREAARDLETHIQELIERAEPGIVAIVASSNPNYLDRPDPDQPGKLGDYPTPQRSFGGKVGYDPKLDLSDPNNVADNQFGTGIVLDEEGLILTTWHLIEGARKVFVRTTSGVGCYADIHAADARSDLAVIKLQSSVPGLKALKLANGRLQAGPKGEPATIKRGQWVISLGHPFAAGVADGIPSASWGIISNVRRRSINSEADELRTKALHQYSILIQTDARLTLGSSGAPLLNLDGEVVGISMPTAAITGVETAGGFALPVDQNYTRIIERLKSGQAVEYGFLGVSFRQPQPGERQINGLLVSNVLQGLPAAEAGLRGSDGRFGFRGDGRPGDIILEVDGVPIREHDDLFMNVGAALAGTVVQLTVMRDNRRIQVPVKLAKAIHEFPYLASVKPPDAFGLRVDYSSIFLLKIDQRAIPPSVMIQSLEKNSPAEQKLGQLPDVTNGHWLITKVDGVNVPDPPSFYNLIKNKPTIRLTLYNPLLNDTGRVIQLP